MLGVRQSYGSESCAIHKQPACSLCKSDAVFDKETLQIKRRRLDGLSQINFSHVGWLYNHTINSLAYLILLKLIWLSRGMLSGAAVMMRIKFCAQAFVAQRKESAKIYKYSDKTLAFLRRFF